MPDRILVVNPDSTDSVTQGIDEAMAPLRIPGGPEIRCVTLAEGPPAVESLLISKDYRGAIYRRS